MTLDVLIDSENATRRTAEEALSFNSKIGTAIELVSEGLDQVS